MRRTLKAGIQELIQSGKQQNEPRLMTLAVLNALRPANPLALPVAKKATVKLINLHMAGLSLNEAFATASRHLVDWVSRCSMDRSSLAVALQVW